MMDYSTPYQVGVVSCNWLSRDLSEFHYDVLADLTPKDGGCLLFI